MKSALVASVRETRGSDRVRRTLTVNGGAEVFFEISGGVLPPAINLYDFAAVATLFFAMRERRPLHIDGPVSAALLRNLEELQEVWAMWRPSSYAPVPVTAAEERDGLPERSPKTGVFAFSGGVDGTAALLRHHAGKMNRRTIQPIAAVMIHGFDIPLSKGPAFDTARAAAEAILHELNLLLCIIRTNWLDVLCRDWEMEFGAGLAACLHQFAGLSPAAVLGSDEDYAHLSLPWGSNPITNHFLSGGGFAIQTDCGGLTRTERVALICEYPRIAARLRVCWEGPVTGRNCGKCEKCTRTQMNFLAVGQEPLCFSGRPTQAQIIGINARNPVQIAYLEEILDSARKHGARGPWVKALATSIAKNKALLPLRPALEPTKAIGRRAWNKAVRLVKERVAGRSQSAQ